MKRLFAVDSPLGLIVAAAALRAGSFDRPHTGQDASSTPVENIALLVESAEYPELVRRVTDLPGLAPVVDVFDRVISLNDTIFPLHPAHWEPTVVELPVWERLMRNAWSLGGESVELVVESLTVGAGLALARIFANTQIHLCSAHATQYSPAPKPLTPAVRLRISQTVHWPLVAGLDPAMASEYAIATTAVPTAAISALIDDVVANIPVTDSTLVVPSPEGRPTALLLGQNLAQQGHLSLDEESDVHVDMVRQAVADGAQTIVFVPHPGTPHTRHDLLQQAAQQGGSSLTIDHSGLPAEVLAQVLAPDRIISGTTSAILTIRQLWDFADRDTHALSSIATHSALHEIAPLSAPARMTAALVDAVIDQKITDADAVGIMTALAFSMQPRRLMSWQAAASTALAPLPEDIRERYINAVRRTALKLPTSSEEPATQPTTSDRSKPKPTGKSARKPVKGKAVAWVESPFQAVGVMEAQALGLLGDEVTVVPREGIPGLATTMSTLRALSTPPGTVLAGPRRQIPWAKARTLVVGDGFSGKFQTAILTRRGIERLVIVDDGRATITLVEHLASPAAHTSILQRSEHASASGLRRVLAEGTYRRLRHLMSQRRLTVVTAMPIAAEVASAFEAAGGILEEHHFGWVAQQPAIEKFSEPTIVIGSALAADHLIDSNAYLAWIRSLTKYGPVAYIPHRRQTPDLLQQLSRIKRLTVHPSTLPIEMRLRGLQPQQRVLSLPSTALTTLRTLMADTGATLIGVPIPEEWWTPQATAALRAQIGSARAN